MKSVDDHDVLPDDTPLRPTVWNAEIGFHGNGFTAEDCERVTGLPPTKAWKPTGRTGLGPDFPLSQCRFDIDGRFATIEDAIAAALGVAESHLQGIRHLSKAHSAEFGMVVSLRAFEGSVPLFLPPQLLDRLAAIHCELEIRVPLEWSYSELDGDKSRSDRGSQRTE